MTNDPNRPVGAGRDAHRDARHDETIAAMEADLATTRHELADTVDELAARLDVKTRGKQKAHEVKQRTQAAARSREVQVTGGIVAAVGIVLILVLARRKRG